MPTVKNKEIGDTMAWDFFQQFNSFADLSAGNLSTNAFALYIRLMMINNKAGRIEWFGVTNGRLMSELGLNVGALSRARNDLIQMGFVEYQKGRKGSPSRYKLSTLDENFLKQSKKYSEYFKPKMLPKTYLKCDQKRTENATENAHHIREEYNKKEESRAADARAREGIDEDFGKVYTELGRHSVAIRPIRPSDVAELQDLISEYGSEQVLAAIAEAAKTAKERGIVISRAVKYLAAILESWKRGSVRSGRNAVIKRNTEYDEDGDAIFANQSTPWLD